MKTKSKERPRTTFLNLIDLSEESYKRLPEACPTKEELLDWSLGEKSKLSGEEHLVLECHIARCCDCLDILNNDPDFEGTYVVSDHRRPPGFECFECERECEHGDGKCPH